MTHTAKGKKSRQANMNMTISELTGSEYAATYKASYVYNTTEFAKLNCDKVERIHYLSVHDAKARYGIILGERGEWLCSPFSAPFGGFSANSTHSIERIDETVDLLVDYATQRGKHLRVTLPPMVYDETQLSKWVSAFARKMPMSSIELNFHFDLARMAHYDDFIDRRARQKLTHARKETFNLVSLDATDKSQVARAYEVIRRNREERGFPLRMSLEQVWQTVSQVIKADFWVLEHEGEDVAAAQVFHVADDVAQVIYWGDIREYSALRPMNFLTYELFLHYYKAGLRTLDIGPSTEDGIPNYGLCEFKENIGCSVTLKYCFEK